MHDVPAYRPFTVASDASTKGAASAAQPSPSTGRFSHRAQAPESIGGTTLAGSTASGRPTSDRRLRPLAGISEGPLPTPLTGRRYPSGCSGQCSHGRRWERCPSSSTPRSNGHILPGATGTSSSRLANSPHSADLARALPCGYAKPGSPFGAAGSQRRRVLPHLHRPPQGRRRRHRASLRAALLLVRDPPRKRHSAADEEAEQNAYACVGPTEGRRLLAGLAVERLAQQVGVAAVSGVLPDHAYEDPAQ